MEIEHLNTLGKMIPTPYRRGNKRYYLGFEILENMTVCEVEKMKAFRVQFGSTMQSTDVLMEPGMYLCIYVCMYLCMVLKFYKNMTVCEVEKIKGFLECNLVQLCKVQMF